MKKNIFNHTHHTKKFFRRRAFEIWATIFALFLIIIGAFLFWAATLTLPNLNSFADRKVTQSTKIYDKTGNVLLYDVYQDIRRTVVPYENISVNIKNATVAIEDAEFYQHNGIQIKSIIRALLANLTAGGYTQGGSTITQQVIKNSLLTSDKTITRKLKEWILSLRLEKTLTKEEILATYLNEAPYGGSLYGVEEASKAFFGVTAKDLTLAQAAYLAALPQAPSYYSPYGSHKKELVTRKNLVLSRMKLNGFITEDQYNQAIKETVSFKPQGDMNIKAPHFVMFIKDYLEKKYGENITTEGGLKVITTLDYDLQSKAEEIVKKWALVNKDKYKASNAALVAIDPKTGGILAMVGSRDYFDKEIDGNYNIATAERQPGSSFKPIVYAQAFTKGLRPETVVFDLKTQFSTRCSVDNTTSDNGCYSPENYDQKFRGPVSLREALAQSLNIPAIQVFYLAGMKDALNLARNMGITTLNNLSQYGLTLVLGGGEVSLLDMTSAYSIFANQGMRNPYTGIVSVEDKDGKTLEAMASSTIGNPVLSKNVALQISSILNDEKARSPEFGSHSALYFKDRDVAVKTGTTNDYRDAWIIGYTPSITVGAWAGNNDNSPMEKKIAGFIVAPMWHEFMEEILKRVPDEKFPEPEVNTSDAPPVIRGFWQGGKTYTIDTVSGKLASELTPTETQKEIPIQNIHSILYWIDKDNPLQDRTDDPNNDPQFKYWEYPIQKWAQEKGLVNQNESVIPKETDDVHVSGKMPIVSLSLNNSTSSVQLRETDNAIVTVGLQSFYPITKGDIYINNKYYGPLSIKNPIFSFKPKELEQLKAFNDIRVVVTDSVFNTTEAKIDFSVEQAN